ncbi:hypothetical protein CEXT_734891 [Caerostris extrusa]|uniref:Uncharacterized protein n=1 Tax=Caerostris extrusa TaxID=172846 RepID=A0AAV4NBG9_CAEEX|nr:hypothetical protein CEXT_734891 [Caerostris extrusa]
MCGSRPNYRGTSQYSLSSCYIPAKTNGCPFSTNRVWRYPISFRKIARHWSVSFAHCPANTRKSICKHNARREINSTRLLFLIFVDDSPIGEQRKLIHCKTGVKQGQ